MLQFQFAFCSHSLNTDPCSNFKRRLSLCGGLLVKPVEVSVILWATPAAQSSRPTPPRGTSRSERYLADDDRCGVKCAGSPFCASRGGGDLRGAMRPCARDERSITNILRSMG